MEFGPVYVLQMALMGLMETIGNGLMDTLTDAVLVQPLAAVAVTMYMPDETLLAFDTLEMAVVAVKLFGPFQV